MLLASEIRKVLHGYGIHSATIQPEFIEDQIDEKYQPTGQDMDGSKDDEKLQLHGIERVTTVTNSVYQINDDSKQNTSSIEVFIFYIHKQQSATCILTPWFLIQ